MRSGARVGRLLEIEPFTRPLSRMTDHKINWYQFAVLIPKDVLRMGIEHNKIKFVMVVGSYLNSQNSQKTQIIKVAMDFVFCRRRDFLVSSNPRLASQCSQAAISSQESKQSDAITKEFVLIIEPK